MSFVDFMIVGANKSSTSTLANILAKHPDICFCQKKEPQFFSKVDNWQDSLADYRALFTPTDNQLCGEASTTYTCYPEFNKEIWASLYEFNPKLKLIYIMRHPIDRMVSHYMHNYLRGYTNSSFEEDVICKPTYLNRTRYYTQIRPYLEYFGREQVLLLTFEEFLSAREAVLSRVSHFLGIDFSKFIDFETVHRNKSIGDPKNNIRVDRIKDSKWANIARPFIPRYIRASVSKNLHRLTERKFESKPNITAELKTVLWNLIMLEVLEVEKLMQRELTEWNIPRSSLTKASDNSLIDHIKADDIKALESKV